MKSVKFFMIYLFLAPVLAGAQEKGEAKIITGMNQAAQCISPVHIMKIDGREAAVQPMGFSLEPGKHTLSGKAKIDTSVCGMISSRATGQQDIPPLEAEFEAGKTYWIGLNHKSSNRNDWKYVIWKVE